MLVAQTENQVKKISCVNLTIVGFRSIFEDFTHEANLQFTESTDWFNRFKNHQQPYNIQCTVELSGSDILAAEWLLKVVIQLSKQCQTQP